MLKVFVSHSTADLGPVYQLRDWLRANAIQTYVAELYPSPGIELPSKIASYVDWSDCVIAVMTKDGDRSAWVNQEIGYARKAGKLIVPIVENGVETKGFLTSIEFVPFNKSNPVVAISHVTSYLIKLKANKEQQENLNAIIIAFFAILGIAALSEKK